MSRGGGPRHGLRSDRGVVTLVVAMLVALLGAGVVWSVSRAGGDDIAHRRRAAAAGDAPSATLRILEPGGELRRAGKSQFRAARDGQVLRQGDTVRSDATGTLEVDYADGSLTRLASVDGVHDRTTHGGARRATDPW